MTMDKPAFHILVCGSFRGAQAKGVCHQKESLGLLPYLEEEIIARGLDAFVSSTSCLKACDHGPVMVVYPKGDWYGEVDEELIDEVLDGLESGGTAQRNLL